MLESMLLDTYTWFADLVKDRRGLSEGDAKGLLDGSVFTGKQALDRKLIDAIGGEDVARKWLVEEKKIDQNLEIVSWSLSKPEQEFFLARAMIDHVLSSLGLAHLYQSGKQTVATQGGLNLDGFLSVWQVNR